MTALPPFRLSDSVAGPSFSGRTDLVLASCFCAIACALILPNLGDRALWEDEAETALIARGIVRTGWPVAWDGRVLVTPLGGSDLTDSLLSALVPWAPRYLAAAGLALAGDTAFGARLPFALLGCISVGLTFLLAQRLSRDRWVACFATLLLLGSVQYLLLARQCRYYMLVLVAALVALRAYESLSTRRDLVVLTLSLAVLFHANYGSFVCFGAGLFLHALVARRTRPVLLRLAGVALAVGLLTLPWFLALGVFERIADMPVSRPPVSLEFVKTTFVINRFVSPWLVLLGLGIAGLRGRLRFGGTYVLAVCMILPALVLLPSLLWANPRYLPYLLCIGCIVVAAAAREVHARHRWAGYLVAGLLGLTPLPAAVGQSLLPGRVGSEILRGEYETGLAALRAAPFRREWLDYARELRRPFHGPDEAITGFLNRYAEADDLVYASLNSLPIMFHTNLRVAGVLPPKTRRRPGWDRLPDHLWIVAEADWLILRRRGPDGRFDRHDRELFESFRRAGHGITRHDLPVRDVGWANRPLLGAHHFVAPAPEEGKNLVIFRLRDRD